MAAILSITAGTLLVALACTAAWVALFTWCWMTWRTNRRLNRGAFTPDGLQLVFNQNGNLLRCGCGQGLLFIGPGEHIEPFPRGREHALQPIGAPKPPGTVLSAPHGMSTTVLREPNLDRLQQPAGSENVHAAGRGSVDPCRTTKHRIPGGACRCPNNDAASRRHADGESDKARSIAGDRLPQEAFRAVAVKEAVRREADAGDGDFNESEIGHTDAEVPAGVLLEDARKFGVHAACAPPVAAAAVTPPHRSHPYTDTIAPQRPDRVDQSQRDAESSRDDGNAFQRVHALPLDHRAQDNHANGEVRA